MALSGTAGPADCVQVLSRELQPGVHSPGCPRPPAAAGRRRCRSCQAAGGRARSHAAASRSGLGTRTRLEHKVALRSTS